MPGRAPGESESDDQAGARRANRAVTRVWKGKWRRFAPRFSTPFRARDGRPLQRHRRPRDVRLPALRAPTQHVQRSAVEPWRQGRCLGGERRGLMAVPADPGGGDSRVVCREHHLAALLSPPDGHAGLSRNGSGDRRCSAGTADSAHSATGVRPGPCARHRDVPHLSEHRSRSALDQSCHQLGS